MYVSCQLNSVEYIQNNTIHEVNMYEDLYKSICDAYSRISPDIVKTPMIRSDQFSEQYQCSLHLKMEHKQRTGSFKLRGAHNKLSLLSQSLKTGSGQMKTIVTASTGNHGLACLDAMSRYNVRGKIAVPETISQVNILTILK